MREVPLSEFRVPDGQIGLTIDLHGVDPVSITLPVEKIEETLAVTEATLRINSRARRRVEEHVKIRRVLIATMSTTPRDSLPFKGAATSFLWCLLNHPAAGPQLREGMARALRQSGRAHASVVIDARHRVAFSLGERALDRSEAVQLMAGAPAGASMVVTSPTEPEPALH